MSSELKSEEINDGGTFNAGFCSSVLFLEKQQKARKGVSVMFFSAGLALTSDPIMQGNPCSVAFPMQLLGGWVISEVMLPVGTRLPGCSLGQR